MSWFRRSTEDQDKAQRRLEDLEERQAKVAAAASKFKQENGFIRMIRESMGPAN